MDMQLPPPVRDAATRAATAALAALREPTRQGTGNQVLSFHVGGSTYAMPIAHIKEIIEYGPLTAIPLVPRFIRGVINLRGAVLPVIDLAARLGLTAGAPGPRTCIVIVEMRQDEETLDLGVVVDGVSEVLELADEDLEPPPSFGAQIRTDFIQAMARIRGRFVIVMRLAQVLSISEMSALARLSAEGRPELPLTPAAAH